MRKDLLISLGVMLLLTIIVGFTAFNLTSRWAELPDIITKNVAKEMLLEEISSMLDKEMTRVDLYVLNSSEKTKQEIILINNNIIDRLKSLKYISDTRTSEEQRVKILRDFYEQNIYNLIEKILAQKDQNLPIDKYIEDLNILSANGNQILERINKEKLSTLPIYEQNINELKNYSKSVTFIITLICGLLGFILMAISVNHISTLYEKIENQAKQLEVNLEEIKQINKELIKSNELNVKIQEAERLRISHDLHDEVIQGLINLVRLADKKSALETDTDFKSELNSIIVHIRKICQNLRPSILDDLGLNSAIEWLLDDLEKFGIVPHIDIDENIEISLPKKTELMVFRIIQELTNNIKKHSQATNTWLKITNENKEIQILIKDDGCGFNYNEENINKTLGLVGIKERVKSVSGKLDIQSEINKGTEVKIFIPLSFNKEKINEEDKEQ
ncbi:MAG: sensor histidine kinase [Cyanobacteriota bacterium]